MADEIQTCKIAGMDDFLAKPIDVERLAAALAACRRLDASDAA
jgi:CheY-like chemotaxis protein